jgi:hypothetical protein
MTFDLGAAAQLSFTALDSTGAAANAATCTITITLPDGTSVGPTTLTGTAGIYTYQYVTTQAGRHTYRFATSGAPPSPGVGGGAYSDIFNVAPATSVALISLADAKALLRIAVSTYDTDLRGFITAISRFIDKYVGDVAPRQITAERHRSGGNSLMLRHIPVFQPAGQPWPLTSITPVMTYGYTYDLSQLAVDLSTGEVKNKIGLPFFLGDYDLAYWAGRLVTTENIQLAVQIMLKHLWALERNSGRPSGFTPSAADDTTLMYGFAVPNRALEVLEPDRTAAGIA